MKDNKMRITAELHRINISYQIWSSFRHNMEQVNMKDNKMRITAELHRINISYQIWSSFRHSHTFMHTALHMATNN